MMPSNKLGKHELEDYEPGASKKQVMEALKLATQSVQAKQTQKKRNEPPAEA